MSFVCSFVCLFVVRLSFVCTFLFTTVMIMIMTSKIMKRINFIANIKLLVLFYKRVGATSEEVYHTVGDMELKGAAIDV